MIYLPFKEMDVNKFVDAQVPTKKQIFARTGQHAVSPAGSYTGDESAQIGLSTTAQMENFAEAAERAAEKAARAASEVAKSPSDEK